MKTQYAVITGASSGIGFEFAREFARRGIPSVLVARSQTILEQLASSLSSEFSVKSVPFPADLTHADDRNRLVDFCAAEGFTIEYLVNSAGYGSNGLFPELDIEKEIRMTELNCIALQELSYRFTEIFIRNHGGTIINVASTASFQPVPFMASYAATKSFVLSLSLALRIELAGSGVTVFALCPGPVDTNFFRNARMKKPRRFLRVHPPEFVVRKAFNGLDSGRAFLIVGILNKVLYYTGSLLPLTFRARVAGKMFERKARRRP